MKYKRLTKEQFDELEQEFINFLATQSITAEEWARIKEEQPKLAEDELDVFSDLVWEGVLTNASYLENISPKHLFLFKLGTDGMEVIVVKILDQSKDLTTKTGFKWLQENFASDEVEFQTAVKSYSTVRNIEIFELIQQGAIITRGELFEFFNKILNT